MRHDVAGRRAARRPRATAAWKASARRRSRGRRRTSPMTTSGSPPLEDGGGQPDRGHRVARATARQHQSVGPSSGSCRARPRRCGPPVTTIIRSPGQRAPAGRRSRGAACCPIRSGRAGTSARRRGTAATAGCPTPPAGIDGVEPVERIVGGHRRARVVQSNGHSGRIGARMCSSSQRGAPGTPPGESVAHRSARYSDAGHRSDARPNVFLQEAPSACSALRTPERRPTRKVPRLERCTAAGKACGPGCSPSHRRRHLLLPARPRARHRARAGLAPRRTTR